MIDKKPKPSLLGSVYLKTFVTSFMNNNSKSEKHRFDPINEKLSFFYFLKYVILLENERVKEREIRIENSSGSR